MSLACMSLRALNKIRYARSLALLSSRGVSVCSISSVTACGSGNCANDKGQRFCRYLSAETAACSDDKDAKKKVNIIKDTEKAIGQKDTHDFQAETRMLLDIVARSLYSEKEVFLRELISNASDALEKLRYVAHTTPDAAQSYHIDENPAEIHIGTDKINMLLTIQDTGIGMTRAEITNNLGTIANSGSKRFLEKLRAENASSNDTSSNIIGQFGVGFYSVFMVADKIVVYSRSALKGSVGMCWMYDGTGSYAVQEAEGVAVGTKIVIHLKTECREYSDEDRVIGVIKKYSNFIRSPIYVNGKRTNEMQPLWLMDTKEVTKEQHNDFYRFIANAYDTPRFVLHYKADAPLNIRALLYVPRTKPGLFDLSHESDSGIALYSRKMLIQPKTKNIVPKWLRFLKGVVDSEDIPLNLSREILQNSGLIKKLCSVLTSRVVRFLHECTTKQPSEYEAFYRDYSLFIKEGIVTTEYQPDKESYAKLLRFYSSKLKDDKCISLEDYLLRNEGQSDIFYLAAPNRVLAESSPYFENFKKRNIEVLFCYDPYDELVLMQLGAFKGKNLISVEKELRKYSAAEDESDMNPDALSRTEIDDLFAWIRDKLLGKIANVRVTSLLDTYPCVITVDEMAAARHFIRTQRHQVPEHNRFALLQPQLEINPKHGIIKKLNKLRKTNAELAEMLLKQLFENSMVGAGLSVDPRSILAGLNNLLEKALENH